MTSDNAPRSTERRSLLGSRAASAGAGGRVESDSSPSGSKSYGAADVLAATAAVSRVTVLGPGFTEVWLTCI
jgi:hypothetical protein